MKFDNPTKKSQQKNEPRKPQECPRLDFQGHLQWIHDGLAALPAFSELEDILYGEVDYGLESRHPIPGTCEQDDNSGDMMKFIQPLMPAFSLKAAFNLMSVFMEHLAAYHNLCIEICGKKAQGLAEYMDMQNPGLLMLSSYLMNGPGFNAESGVRYLNDRLQKETNIDSYLNEPGRMKHLKRLYTLATKLTYGMLELSSGQIPDRDILAGCDIDTDLLHTYSTLRGNQAIIEVQTDETPAMDSFYMAASICRDVKDSLISMKAEGNLTIVSLRFADDSLQVDISYAGSGRNLINPGISEDPIVQHLQMLCGKRLHVEEAYVVHNMLHQQATYSPGNQTQEE